jgi:hypothetical protein
LARGSAGKLTADAMLPPPTGRAMAKTTEMVICVGASTGGTEALREFLKTTPANAPGWSSCNTCRRHSDGACSRADRPTLMSQREEWFESQIDLDPQRLVFIDETSARQRWRVSMVEHQRVCDAGQPFSTAIGKQPRSRRACVSEAWRRLWCWTGR